MFPQTELLGHRKSCLAFRCKIIKNLAPVLDDFMVRLIADTFPIFFLVRVWFKDLLKRGL